MTILCAPLQITCHQKCFEGERGGGGAVSRRGKRIQENAEEDRAGRMMHGDEGRDRNREGGGMCKER